MPCSEQQINMVNLFLKEVTNRPHDTKESIIKQVDFILYDQSHLIENCLEILDDHSKQIKRIKSANTIRCFWKVPSHAFKGAYQKDYTCTEKYCTCKSFTELAKISRQSVLCKHLLAVRIGTALNLIVEQVVQDTVFADMMCN
jgi:predicted nucleic acid-binding Zn finger protein